MSLHNKPKYQIPELVESLKAHGLDADEPSQLSDAFRTGWVAALQALRSMPAEPVAWQYRPKHPTTGEVVGPWMICRDVERARACGYEVRQVRECRACDGEGLTEQGDPEIGSAKFDCPTCNGYGCIATPHTAPVPLSDAEIEALWSTYDPGNFYAPIEFARAIERAVIGRVGGGA